jgi:CRISPR/Cas system-associated exonuclease Cas4 (RecB family)
LVTCDELFDNIKNFAYETTMIFSQQNVSIENENLIGEIDLITSTDEIWEIKCTSDISLKHVLQVLMYNLLKNEYKEEKSIINLNFINFLKGNKTIFNINLTQEEIARIKEIFFLIINKPIN